MIYHKFHDKNQFSVAVLVKTKDFAVDKIAHHYVAKLNQDLSVIALDLYYTPDNKAPVKLVIEPCLDALLPVLDAVDVTLVVCTDAAYFKKLTGITKPTNTIGNVVDSTYGEFKFKVVYVPNYVGLFVNPDLQQGIDLGTTAINSYFNGNYTSIGENVIKHSECYSVEDDNFIEGFKKLFQYPSLTCDIETVGNGETLSAIQHNKNTLMSIAFAWNKHEGIYFDLGQKAAHEGRTLSEKRITKMLTILKYFFMEYKGNLKFHNAPFDIKCLVRHLFMLHSRDRKGMYKGIDCLTRDFDCTQAITYLALNSTIYDGKSWLSLKIQAYEYLGDYGEDVKDVSKLKPEANYIYNLKDVLGTWYVYDKNYPKLVADEQLDFYENMAKPILINIISMELTGLPIDMGVVRKTELKLNRIIQKYSDYLMSTRTINQFTYERKIEIAADKTAKAAKKVYSEEDISYEFNTGSNLDKQKLLHEYMELPVLATTKSGQPNTGGKTLKALQNITTVREYRNVLRCIDKIEEAKKIVGTFIKAFHIFSHKDINGDYWLYGSLKFGGCISGRLSSSMPNLANLPSGSHYGKVIKKCFTAPSGFVFAGQDYNALESRVNTLLTQDPNKRKVFTDGFDAHMLASIFYWRDKFPDVDTDDVNQVNNQIKTPLGKKLRQEGKRISFSGQYGGTWRTFMVNCGFSEAEAKQLEKNYHELYKVSDEWAAAKIDEVTKLGYATVAFGLRIRAPILHSTILGTRVTPKEAEREKRTVSNAISGQSYGLLNSRLSFMLEREIRKAGYEEDIMVCNNIHDAVYVVCKATTKHIHWLNTVMPKLGEWGDLPELYDPEIKLSGEVDLFYPTWANEIHLKPYCTKEELVLAIKSASH